MCVFKFFFEITEPTEDKVHVGPPRDREKIYSNDSGQLVFILILSAPNAQSIKIALCEIFGNSLLWSPDY